MNDKTRRLSIEEAKFKALECRELALRSNDPAYERKLEAIAAEWDELVEMLRADQSRT